MFDSLQMWLEAPVNPWIGKGLILFVLAIWFVFWCWVAVDDCLKSCHRRRRARLNQCSRKKRA